MPAISKRGTSLPGGRPLSELAPAGNGFGRGASGRAKRFLEAGVMSPAFEMAGLFSVGAAAPSAFFWAYKGKAKRALAATTANQLRIIVLPQFSRSEPQPSLYLTHRRRRRHSN